MTAETSNARGEWVLVPREPTQAMREAFNDWRPTEGNNYAGAQSFNAQERWAFRQRYAALLAAAPQQPAAEAQGGESAELRRMVAKLAAHVRLTCSELWAEAQAFLAAEGAQAGEVEDGPIDASDNAEYIEHCADRLERCGLRVTAGALRVIAHEHRTLVQQPAPPSAPDYPITATCRVCDYDYRCVPVPAKCGTCGSDLPPSAPVGVEAVRGAWLAAITLANNICVQESDRENDRDGDTAWIDGTAECAKRIREYAHPTDAELLEMLDEAGANAAKTALAQQPAAVGRNPAHAWPAVDRLLIDAYNAGTDGTELDLIAARRKIAALAQQPAIGEEIMVNAAHDVFTLPLQPSGLSSGPRFVVHVPAPEQQPEARGVVDAKPVGTITRRDSGDEVIEHQIALDPDFEESLYRYPAGTVINLYAEAAADVALAHVQAAAAALTQQPAPVGVELSALRVQEWLQREYDILPPVQEIEQAMRTPCSCPDTERALAQQPAAVDESFVERFCGRWFQLTGRSLDRPTVRACFAEALAAQRQEPTT